MNTSNEVTGEVDAALNDALSRVQGIQVDFARSRGRRALASMIGTAFVQIDYIMNVLSEADRAALLDRHQIKMRANANRFSPYIACVFGEFDPTKPKVTGLDGLKYGAWSPDANYSVYFHTMEWCIEQGFDRNSDVKKVIAAIADQGAQTIANARKKRIGEAEKRDNAPTVQKQREVYLEDGPAIAVDLSGLTIPTDADKFIAIIAERTETGFVIRGVSDKNAGNKLNKLAGDAYEKLNAAREAAVERERIKAEVRAEMESEQAEGAKSATATLREKIRQAADDTVILPGRKAV